MPGILSEAELDSFRALARDLAMPDEALILRGTVTPNGFGGHSRTYGTFDFGGTIYHPCRFTKSSPQEKAIAGLTLEESSWTVVFPAGWDVDSGDRIHLISATMTVEVQGVLGPKTWEIQRRVICTYFDV